MASGPDRAWDGTEVGGLPFAYDSTNRTDPFHQDRKRKIHTRDYTHGLLPSREEVHVSSQWPLRRKHQSWSEGGRRVRVAFPNYVGWVVQTDEHGLHSKGEEDL